MKSLKELQSIFKQYIKDKEFLKEPIKLYEPFEYILNIGGKKIRPVLLLATNQMFHGKLEDSLPASLAIELFHNFTLIHDDIMDVAMLRRGKPTVHTKFGINSAILTGDAMLIYAYKFMADSRNCNQSLPILNKTGIEVCEGQQLDMDFENRDNVTVDDYLEMIRLKTAVLLASSLQIGAITANASKKSQHNIYQFGLNLGMSFQIMDDILDAFATNEKFGKQIGGDILLNKKTYLTLRAFENADEKQREELNKWNAITDINHPEKVENVKHIYRQTGAEKDAYDLAEKYYQKGLEYLQKIKQRGYNTEFFEQFSDQLLHRTI